MPPYGEYNGYAAPAGGGYPQYPPPQPVAAAGYAASPPQQAAYAMPQYGMMAPQPMPVMPLMAAAPPPPQPAPVAYAAAPAAATIPIVYQQQKKSKAGGLFGGLRNKSTAAAAAAGASAAYIPAAAPPVAAATAPTSRPTTAGGVDDFLKSTENGMESIYASTPDQIRRAADYNEKESQRLLSSLMSSNRGKKEMQQITSKAYAHANEAKRLLRKAELLDAELRLQKEEREHDDMERRRLRQSRNPYAGCGVAPGIGASGDVEMRQQDNGDGGDCNMALCGAFGGGTAGGMGDHDSVLLHDDNDVGGQHASHYDANSIIHHRPASIQVKTTAPSYDIKDYKDAAPSDDNGDAPTRGRSKNRGGLVMGFLRGRSKSRDAPTNKTGDDDQTNGEYTHLSDIGFSRDGAPLGSPDIVHNIHKVEAEITNILDHEDSGDGADDDGDSAGYAVAPSSLKVISKVDAVRPPKEQPRKMRPGDVVLDLSAMLIDEERDRAAGKKLPGETSLSKPVDMKKRSTSFRKTISRLAGKGGKSKTAQGFIGTDDSDDEEQIDFGISHQKMDTDSPSSKLLQVPSSTSREDATADKMKGQQSDKDRIDALEWRNPAQIARSRADDMSLPAMSPRHRPGLGSQSFNGSVASFAVKAKFAQLEVGSATMNGTSRKLENGEEIATAVKNGKLRRTKPKPSALDRQRSRKDQTHDELDAGAIKVSESFHGFVNQRRSDLMAQKKQNELSQMKAFYDTYGEEAYREVYGPYEQQLGYGLFYNEQGPLDQDGAEQSSGNLQEGPTSMAFGSQSNLGRIPEDKPVTRGRSTVRSAARKMKRSLSRKRDKKQSRNELQKAASYQSTEHQQSHQDNKSMHSRSMASRSRGVDSSTKLSSANGNSDGAAFHFVPPHNGSNYAPDGRSQEQEQWNGQTQAFVGPTDQTTDAPYYTDTPSPMNSHRPSYYDHNQAQQQQQWGDGINEYRSSPPSPTARAQYHPISVTDSQLARQRSSNRNNKQSVDMMLRRMRSESTEEIESRSAAANHR